MIVCKPTLGTDRDTAVRHAKELCDLTGEDVELQLPDDVVTFIAERKLKCRCQGGDDLCDACRAEWHFLDRAADIADVRNQAILVITGIGLVAILWIRALASSALRR